jgi:hypothetical protein
MYLKEEIMDYINDIGDVNDVFEKYDLDSTSSDDDFASALQDDEDLRDSICSVIYHDPDAVVENVDQLEDAVSDGYTDDATLGQYLREGNWAALEEIIRNVSFYSEVYDASSEWWSDHEDEIEQLQNDEDEDYAEDEDEDSEVETNEEDYDEGFEESMHRPRRIRYNK